MKKTVALILAFLLLAPLAAFASEYDGGPMVITVYLGDSLNKNSSQWSDTEIGKIVEERTGVRVQIEYIVGANEDEAAGRMIATQQYPDIIIPHNVGNTFRDAGALLELNDLYLEHCPNIQKNWGNNIERLKDVETGILWGLSSSNYNSPAMDYPFSGFWMKHAAVAQNGYEVIRTKDDYFNAIRAYVEANPTVNGQPTIGFSGPAEEWRWVFFTQGARKIDGWHNTGGFVYDPVTYQATSYNRMDGARDYFLFMNELHREGLLDPELLSQTHDEYVAKVASGRVVGFYDEWWQVMDAFALIKQENRADDLYIPFSISSESAQTGMNDVYAGIQAMAVQLSICISRDAEDPVAILKFVDYLASDEMQELLMWGVEGVHFQKDENGRRYLTEEQYEERNLDVRFSDRTGIGHSFARAIPARLDRSAEWEDGSGVTDPNEDRKIRSQIIYNDMEKGVLANMGWSTFMDGMGEMWKSPYGYAWDIGVPEDDDLLQDARSAIFLEGEHGQNFFQHMIMAGSTEEALAIWDQLQAYLIDGGVEALEEYFTMRVLQRVEEWN